MSQRRKPVDLKAAELRTRDGVTYLGIERLQEERSSSTPPGPIRSAQPMDPPDPRYTRPRGVACDFCTERKVRAVSFCQTCTASYCETHVKQHHTVPALQRHTLEEAPADLQPGGLCEAHNRALTVFCRTDQILICNLCALEKHKSHDVERKQGRRQVYTNPPYSKGTWTLQETPPSPSHSYRSSRRKSLEQPPIFQEDFAFDPGEQVDRAGSPVPSCVSMKSDASMDHPSSLKEDFSPNESGAWPGGMACDLCTERKVRAVKFCQTCTASYCETHVRQHYTVPALQRHTLEEAPADLQPELCSQHHRALELFCNTDRTLICSVCSVQTHRGHDVVCYESGTQDQTHSPPKAQCQTSSAKFPLIQHTDGGLEEQEQYMSRIGLKNHLKEKLSLTALLDISSKFITEQPTKSLRSLPWCFLKKLMMMNTTARSVRCAIPEDLEGQDDSSPEDDEVNPLDLITALFLCSDGFLQQQMAVKMSMCQFSVPLLLPNSDTQQPTLMLWALRDIVKKFRPHSFLESKGFVEKSIVLTQLPLISFVRLGNSSLSKSHILNQILSNPQQYHDTFIHYNMTGGDTPRRISEGLVEISWYLPCGNRNMDIFPEPVAVANLRGDISAFETQFSFLCKISSAVFVFCDDLGPNSQLLKLVTIEGKIYLVCHSANVNESEFQKHQAELQLEKSHILRRESKGNDEKLVTMLRVAVKSVISGSCIKKTVEQMSEIAHELGISVDEDYIHCQSAKVKANAITASISDVLKYKQTQLPLQGEIWKELARLEKEECRLKKAGDKNIEKYRSELSQQKQRLREQQRAHGMSTALSCFVSALSGPKEERSYFLKWMKISLDHLSLRHLSDLREMYKELCLNSPQNKQKIHDLDRQISSSSLGVEHFLREMGQLYESACSLPENHPYRQQMQNLPRYCAQLLLDGLPVELIDGDASNIPLQWVKDVLTELHHLTHPNSRIRVITVLGVQSTGKSTLLNTIFGVQFAVSSSTCTRGAFMLLIRVQEDFREQLGCDFIMVIDTEGLKSPELAQLADSYDHDNELATLVVGLSDITIINIAMENSTEMKDVLQIVVHAFLRMKEVGKKPCCMFVHQNVADVSAHDKKMRDRNLLLEQLNEMTQAAARMEKKVESKKFTDVMDYDPERNTWYIPGLWHGTPPMAPVNAGYSETVSEVKRSMIEALIELKEKRPAQTISQFLEWISSLWKAVKYENFIFSFQNSLVANTYTKLCSEYNSWDWNFRKHMYNWVINAETRVSNFGTITPFAQPPSSLEDLLICVKNEASVELDKELNAIMGKITDYFKMREGHVYLVEKYREDFMNSAKTLKRETQSAVMMKLEAAVEIKKGMAKIENIRKNHKTTIEQQVLKLLDSCRKAKTQMTEKHLELEFEKMWKETMQKLSFTGLPRQNVGQEIYSLLRSNLETKGGSVHEMLHKASPLDQCGLEPFEISKEKYISVRYFDITFMQMKKTQDMSDSIVKHSRQFTEDKLRTRTDFHNTHVLELLGLIDKHLERHALGISAELEASLKIHICGHAAREFQKMHDAFIMFNDPRQCLEKFKHQYCTDFKDLFHERDQCQRKVDEFTTQCLEPAVREYVTKSLGPEIVEEMLTGKKALDFSTRLFFQSSILEQLLLGESFEKFLRYIRNYEDFVKDWILGQIEEHFSSRNSSIADMEVHYMKQVTMKIKESVMSVQSSAAVKRKEDMNIQTFIQKICSNLSELLVIPKDALDAVMALNKAKPEQFSDWLLSSIAEMEQSLTAEFQRDKDVRTRLATLPFKPQDELFRRLFGCGKQCPFCKAPCEAGGESHTEHFTSIHRPEGLGTCILSVSSKLSSVICTTHVASEVTFKNNNTNWESHPYKDYRKFYPDWRIQPDTSIQASVYWKFVFAKFNTQFAEEHEAQPADLPETWKSITKEEALQSLETVFKMKRQEEEEE